MAKNCKKKVKNYEKSEKSQEKIAGKSQEKIAGKSQEKIAGKSQE